jgi:type II secretory pathway pseudopilin PulG
LDDGGYILAVLLIGMAIAAVWMSAAIPAWRQQATRQRELELIFRGEQYARSIALYYVKNCTLPTNVDDLVARKFLRKKWNDPITNDDFIIIPGNPQGGGAPVQGGAPGRAGTPGAAGQPSRGGAPVSIGGGTPVSLGGGATGGAQAPRPPGTTGGGSPTGGLPGTSGQTTAGSGIAGVMSKSTAASIIVYNGQQTYQGWQFLYQAQLQKMSAPSQCSGGQPGAPGAPGRGNQPGQGRGDGRGGPTGPAIQGAPGRPGGPGRGGPGDGRGPVTAGVGRGRGGN